MSADIIILREIEDDKFISLNGKREHILKNPTNQKRGTIYLLGDAILDNFYWLKNRDLDLTKELQSLRFNVNNYAVDETRIEDMINGIKPNYLYTSTRSYSYQVDENGKLYPLRMLSQNHTNSFVSVYGGIKSIGTTDEMAVLSIGGNNIKAKFMNIVFGIESLINSVLTKDFIENYDKLIVAIKQHCSRLVLISVYLPYLGPGSSYNKYINLAKPMMIKWNEFLKKLAKNHDVPILDLNQTFDCNNKLHYDDSDIHASNLSNKCLAECLSYIYDHYNGYNIYFAPNCDSAKIQVAK